MHKNSTVLSTNLLQLIRQQQKKKKAGNNLKKTLTNISEVCGSRFKGVPQGEVCTP